MHNTRTLPGHCTWISCAGLTWFRKIANTMSIYPVILPLKLRVFGFQDFEGLRGLGSKVQDIAGSPNTATPESFRSIKTSSSETVRSCNATNQIKISWNNLVYQTIFQIQWEYKLKTGIKLDIKWYKMMEATKLVICPANLMKCCQTQGNPAAAATRLG